MRGIRYWLIELSIVAAGVLLALGAAEWANDRRAARERVIVERELREEVRSNVLSWAQRRTVDACRARDLTLMRNRLVAADGRWPGFREGFAAQRDPLTGIELGGISIGQPNYSDRAFRRAVDSGHFDELSFEKRAIYESFHRHFLIANEATRNMHTYRDRLAFLMYEGSLTPELRAAALSDLASLNQALRDLTRTKGEGMKDALEMLELDVSDDLQSGIRRTRIELTESGIYGDCYRVPDLEITQGMTL